MPTAGEHDALEALEVSKESASVLRKQLKLVPQQVQVVWDVLLWAAADRGKICSQDEITDLLQVCTPSSYIYVHFQCCLWRCIHPDEEVAAYCICLLYTSPSPRDRTRSRMPSSA